jgi:hypothetical protein
MLFIKSFESNCLKNYIMNQFHEEVNNIALNSVFDVQNDIEYKSHENLSSYFLDKYKIHPMYILFLWNFDKEIYDKIRHHLPNTKIIVWTDDIHWFNIDKFNNNYFTYNNADVILSHYNNYMDFYDLNVSNKILQFYHSCSPIFIRDKINDNSLDQVYMYGAINEHYKYRIEFYDLMTKYFPAQFKYRNHPGYDGDQSHITKITSDELYNYSFGFTAGIYPIFDIKEKSDSQYYLIGKFFEIPGSGALLLCNHSGVKNELEKMGFRDKINYIHIDINNFVEIMTFILKPSNRDIVTKIRLNGHLLVKNSHQINNRIETINNFLMKKLLI